MTDSTQPTWPQVVAREARAGGARSLTVKILRSFPELRLHHVVPAIPSACAGLMPRPVFGDCQTIGAGLAAIDVRGPGWVDSQYPIELVLPELQDAGFEAPKIVALFNGNVPIERLGPALRELFPGYVADVDDESLGALLPQRWTCPLPCCQHRDHLRFRPFARRS